jgi:hypothetical protein
MKEEMILCEKNNRIDNRFLKCPNNSQERKNAMNFKKIPLILLSLLLVVVSLGVSTQDAQAQKYSCDLLHPDMTLSTKCDEIFFVLGWAAMTPGQINEFLNATQYTLTLRDGSGNVLKTITHPQVAQFWGPAYPINPTDLGVECAMPQAWETDLMLSLGKLLPGEYTLTLEENFIHPLTDGFQACWVEGIKIPVSLYRGGDSFTASFTIK